jgi:predicted NBD/HSP70 family sugar kinase
LYQGNNGYSGEFGHMIIEVNGRPCSCGSSGCWEMYASEHTLLQMTNQTDATLESLIQRAKENDKNTLELFEEIGRYLGYGINNIINSFNPQQVIIGNRLAKARQWLEAPIKRTIENHSLSFHQNEMEVLFSSLSIYSSALGVAAFVIENFIKDIVITQ